MSNSNSRINRLESDSRLYESSLKEYIKEYKIDAEHLVFQECCHSVDEAVKASGATPEVFIKNICLIDDKCNLIVAIVRGKDSVSSSRIGKILNSESPRSAIPEEILAKSGYPCGGVPSFGYEAQFLIDPKVLEMETVYTGGGSTYSLVKISPLELVTANKGTVVRIRR